MRELSDIPYSVHIHVSTRDTEYNVLKAFISFTNLFIRKKWAFHIDAMQRFKSVKNDSCYLKKKMPYI